MRQTKRSHSLRRRYQRFDRWRRDGQGWIWFCAGALAISLTGLLGILVLIAGNGLAHFWPNQILQLQLAGEEIIGEHLDTVGSASDAQGERWLMHVGNRESQAPDFRWVARSEVLSVDTPAQMVVIERTEWGNAYGHIEGVILGTDGSLLTGKAMLPVLASALEQVSATRDAITALERGSIRRINSELEALRLTRRKVQLEAGQEMSAMLAELDIQERALQISYAEQEALLRSLNQSLTGTQIKLSLANAQQRVIDLATVLSITYANQLTSWERLFLSLQNVLGFLTDTPREANTEGGVFPAIFGTVLMVLLMSVVVAPVGVVTAIYLHEYANQGPLVRLLRIAVSNLAGVPSIVYGVFGLGFFVYFIGGNLDRLFFPEALPAPTFGTPGLIWASLTLALLTVPVVIVSTEEGLARVPQSLREGSLALGATRAETLFHVVLPMATPAMITGVILAVARAAGEVAPLMLVGVVKLAPTLPVDGEFPFLHLERKFMHLGFHIYDLGFQSPNVDAARPLVYATALLLITIIVSLNLFAIALRGRLERHFRGLEGFEAQ